MKQTRPDSPTGCGPCRRCWADLGEADGPSGWRLVLASVGLFLGPVVLAIAGVLLAGAEAEARTAGAVGGLVLGMAISVVIGRLIRRHRRIQVPPGCPEAQEHGFGQEEDE